MEEKTRWLVRGYSQRTENVAHMFAIKAHSAEEAEQILTDWSTKNHRYFRSIACQGNLQNDALYAAKASAMKSRAQVVYLGWHRGWVSSNFEPEQ